MLRMLTRSAAVGSSPSESLSTPREPSQTNIALPVQNQRADFDVRTFLAAFFLIVFALAIHHRNLYFGPPLPEVNDFAANALKITHAKSFDELYGNYSRWKFNHPGPAFFYCYAFGEKVFFDLIPLFHSPHQAHVFMNLLLQSFFLALAFVTFGRLSGSLLFSGLFVLAAAVHFYIAPYASLPLDIWPPEVLAGPLLSLLACAAAVSCGMPSYLPFLTVSAGFLIHGHVAQPLFVVPIAGLSLFLYFRQRKQDRQQSEHEEPQHFKNPKQRKREQQRIKLQQQVAPPLPDKKAWIASAVLAALFAAPILLDMLKGADSNLARIIEHLKTHTGETKSLAQSIGYLLSFFLYKGQEGTSIVVIPDNFSLVPYIVHNLPVLALWTLVIVLPSALLFRPAYANKIIRPGAQARYFRRLMIFCALAFVLTLQWGHMQDGDLYSFNAFFNYAIILVAAVPFCLFIARTIEDKLPSFRRTAQTGILIALVILIFTPASPTISQRESNPAVSRAVASLLNHADRSSYVFLDVRSWNRGVAAALALQRNGIPFRVVEGYGFLFGRRYILPNADFAELKSHPERVWGIFDDGIAIYATNTVRRFSEFEDGK